MLRRGCIDKGMPVFPSVSTKLTRLGLALLEREEEKFTGPIAVDVTLVEGKGLLVLPKFSVVSLKSHDFNWQCVKKGYNPWYKIIIIITGLYRST